MIINDLINSKICRFCPGSKLPTREGSKGAKEFNFRVRCTWIEASSTQRPNIAYSRANDDWKKQVAQRISGLYLFQCIIITRELLLHEVKIPRANYPRDSCANKREQFTCLGNRTAFRWLHRRDAIRVGIRFLSSHDTLRSKSTHGDRNREPVYFRFPSFRWNYYHWIANGSIGSVPTLDPLCGGDRIGREGGEISWPRNQTNVCESHLWKVDQKSMRNLIQKINRRLFFREIRYCWSILNFDI